MQNKGIGIYGGSFDPIHTGHMRLALGAMHEFALSEVVFMVAMSPPHKDELALEDIAHRLNMAKLEADEHEGISVIKDELAGGGKSYTVDMLEAAKLRYGNAGLHYILGEDMLYNLPQWRKPRRILELASLIVIARPNTPVPKGALEWLEPFKERIFWSKLSGMEISSTDIRERVAKNEPITGLVGERVERYIKTNGLYRQGGTT